MNRIESFRKEMKKALTASKRFEAPKSITQIAKYAEKHLSLANQSGEGWFLTGEMVELIRSGVNNIVCLQPFACLPNHITGKGMIREIRRSYPLANIAPIDYDPGASEVNQLNRIKLMLSVALDNIGDKPIDTKPILDLETELQESKLTLMINRDTKLIKCETD